MVGWRTQWWPARASESPLIDKDLAPGSVKRGARINTLLLFLRVLLYQFFTILFMEKKGGGRLG